MGLGGREDRLPANAHQRIGNRDHDARKNGGIRGSENARRTVRGHEKLQDSIHDGIDGGCHHDENPQPPTLLDKIGGPGRNGLPDRKCYENKRNHADGDCENTRVQCLRGHEYETIDQT